MIALSKKEIRYSKSYMSSILMEAKQKYGRSVFPILFDVRQLQEPQKSLAPTMQMTLKENGSVDLDYPLGDVNLNPGNYKLETQLGVGSLIGEMDLSNEEFIEFNAKPIKIIFWKDKKLASGLSKQVWELFRVKFLRLLKLGLANATPSKTELKELDISRLSFTREGAKVSFDVNLGLHEYEFLRKHKQK